MAYDTMWGVQTRRASLEFHCRCRCASKMYDGGRRGILLKEGEGGDNDDNDNDNDNGMDGTDNTSISNLPTAGGI